MLDFEAAFPSLIRICMSAVLRNLLIPDAVVVALCDNLLASLLLGDTPVEFVFGEWHQT